MNSMEESMKFNDVPFGWALCCVNECTKKADCLRYQMCCKVPDGVTKSVCVLPNVLKLSDCPHFHPMKVERVALGFRNIFAEVKEKHHARMRAEISRYLGGGGTFYRYRNGETPLLPEQQEWIKQLFARYGYTEEVVFDEYKDMYRFDE